LFLANYINNNTYLAKIATIKNSQVAQKLRTGYDIVEVSSFGQSFASEF
jgi:hypothetical protein